MVSQETRPGIRTSFGGDPVGLRGPLSVPKVSLSTAIRPDAPLPDTGGHARGGWWGSARLQPAASTG